MIVMLAVFPHQGIEEDGTTLLIQDSRLPFVRHTYWFEANVAALNVLRFEAMHWQHYVKAKTGKGPEQMATILGICARTLPERTRQRPA
ncbi:unnamed protein product [Periconia digitata]|uniref:Uncharacterized protein n=1 Tax=Periconia digitata TaxID=1303443 RepID=A0A9W4UFS1_9PLEO|nr:unnamed protein product [Periconia digitata]